VVYLSLSQPSIEAQKAIDLIDLDEFRPNDKVFWHGSRYEEV
jgi:hypothetical protein